MSPEEYFGDDFATMKLKAISQLKRSPCSSPQKIAINRRLTEMMHDDMEMKLRSTAGKVKLKPNSFSSHTTYHSIRASDIMKLSNGFRKLDRSLEKLNSTLTKCMKQQNRHERRNRASSEQGR